ncbi:MAG: UPF0236 family protein, partial [Streptococcaceae bacterium]|nr:UPF0236 family protein [Streptococcaceae bacterium]
MSFINEFDKNYRKSKQREFIRIIELWDDSQFEQMKSKGWRFVGYRPRTLSFSFGTVMFQRRVYWQKGKGCIVPVDDPFGFEKRQRISRELQVKIVKLALEGTYASAARMAWEMFQVHISVWTVFSAMSYAKRLIQEQEEYRFYEEGRQPVKKQVKQIFVEADGYMLRTREITREGKHWSDFSHYIIHTGSHEHKKGRWSLQGKVEFVDKNPEKAYQKMVDYIYNTYDVTPETLLITNTDGGRGYSPEKMKNLAQDIGASKHEHFWDRFHVGETITSATRGFPIELRDYFFQAINDHDRKLLKTALDTMESLCVTEKDEEDFAIFKKKMKKNFNYTLPPEARGLDRHGIGII